MSLVVEVLKTMQGDRKKASSKWRTKRRICETQFKELPNELYEEYLRENQIVIIETLRLIIKLLNKLKSIRLTSIRFAVLIYM